MYITDALVCGSRDSNTSDRSYLLFTREVGMVWATARSVREEKSKQRFALQEFSTLRITLVRGKGGWRIAGVEPIQNIYYLATERSTRTLVRNIVRLLRRVIQGEEPHATIFDDVIVSFQKSEYCNVDALELVLSLRILNTLGYVAVKDEYSKLLQGRYAYEVTDDLSDRQRSVSKEAIEKALVSSQL